jgi:superfamily I DNA/RNA helicase
MKLSKEQQSVVDTYKATKDNLSVKAVAGSGKTTTAIALGKESKFPNNTCFVAFTNATKDTITAKTNGELTSKTTYSLALTALRSTFQSVDIDKFKYSLLLSDLWDSKLRHWNSLGLSELKRQICRQADQIIFSILIGLNDIEEDVISQYILQGETDLEITPEIYEALHYLVTNGIIQGQKLFLDDGLLSFTDMITFPYYFKDYGILFDQFRLLIVDEKQDLSPAQQFIVKRSLNPLGQYVGVGDPRQWIYGFSGAKSTAFSDLTKMFKAKLMPLSVNFKCSKAVIELARKWCPEITAHSKATLGNVEYLEGDLLDNLASVNKETLVINRNNAPLISLACSMYLEQMPFKFKGDKLAETLIRFINYYRATKAPFKSLESKLTEYADNLTQLNPNHSNLDKINCILVILRSHKVKSYPALIKAIDAVCSGSKYAKVELSTIHKSKGDERHNVIFTGYGKLLSSANEAKGVQKLAIENLLYVGTTRAKENLYTK